MCYWSHFMAEITNSELIFELQLKHIFTLLLIQDDPAPLLPLPVASLVLVAGCCFSYFKGAWSEKKKGLLRAFKSISLPLILILGYTYNPLVYLYFYDVFLFHHTHILDFSVHVWKDFCLS
jgi:hypothetical protein